MSFCSNQMTMVYSIRLNVLVHVVVFLVRPDGGLFTLHVDADVLGVVVCYLSKF